MHFTNLMLRKRELLELLGVLNDGEQGYIDMVDQVGEYWLVRLVTFSMAKWERLSKFALSVHEVQS